MEYGRLAHQACTALGNRCDCCLLSEYWPGAYGLREKTMLGQTSTLQVETEQATSTRNVGSNKQSWLWMIGCGFGCFATGVACAFLVPSGSQEAAHHVMGFNPSMVVPLRQTPATDPQIKARSSLLPRASSSAVRGTPLVMQLARRLSFSPTRAGRIPPHMELPCP
jgi:hypothetical protein